MNKALYKFYDLESMTQEELNKLGLRRNKIIDFIYYNLKFIDDSDLKQGCDIKSEILEPLRDILEENKDSNNAYLEEFKDYMSLKQELDKYKNIVDELEKELNIAYKELQPNEMVRGQDLIKNIQITIKELKGSDG